MAKSVIARKVKKMRLLHLQLLFVTLAFAVMVVACAIFVNGMLMSNLRRDAEALLTQTQTRILSEMREPETLLLQIASDVRDILLNGGNREDIVDYFNKTDAWLRNKSEGFIFDGFQGYFFDFDEKYIPATGWIPPDDFDPTARPWFATAAMSYGDVLTSPIYLSARSLDYQITFVCRIFDDADNALGIVVMNVPLHNISDFILDMRLTEGGYGFLTDENYNLVAHPAPNYINIYMGDISHGLSTVVQLLRQGEDVTELEDTNYENVTSVFYCKKIENGWCLGIATPRNEYYRDYTVLVVFLSVLGIAMLVSVCLILVRIDAAKNKADAKLKDTLVETERLRHEAEAANNAKSAFLSTMSHEIRTPMNAILGITEIQLQKDDLDPEVKEALGMVYSSGDLLLGIINDILDLSKIEAGKLELINADYEIASLISDTAQLNMMRIGSKPIAFELSIDENLPLYATGDELRVKQILNNLLSNAFKYTTAGEVRLSVTCEDRDQLPTKPYPQASNTRFIPNPSENDVYIVFRISDTGQGMTPEQVSMLFDKYTRFNEEANRTIEGAGLGMNITRNLVWLMGGEISVVSEPKKGSVFTVTLPQGKPSDAVLGKEMVENLLNFRTSSRAQMKRVQITREPMPYGRVLIVDDVESNIFVAKGLLVPYELTIESADSGYAAIGKVQSGVEYDIIFMDHMMPEMDGIESTKRIRDMGYKSPIVALTANAVAGQAEMFLENGFDDFISKPIDIRQLNAVLNKLIRDKQPPEVLEAVRQKTAVGMEHLLEHIPSHVISPELAVLFVRDAQRFLAELDTVMDKQGSYTKEDIRKYVISTHGLKSALANIGQKELSVVASRLEQAGRGGNSNIIAVETPAFLSAMRALVEELAPQELEEHGEGAAEVSDNMYLREKLLVIKTACEDFNEKIAEKAIKELQQRKWPRKTKKMLDNISELLLISEYDEAARIVGSHADTLLDSQNA